MLGLLFNGLAATGVWCSLSEDFLFNSVGMTLFGLCCEFVLSGYAVMLWILCFV